MTPPLVALSLLCVCTLYYVFFLTRVRLGLVRLRGQPRSTHHPSVTVIIAARNEESHIGATLRSVLGQRYPPSLLDIVVVDDGSTDGTVRIVEALLAAEPRLRLLRTGADASLGGKVAALTLGIQQSQGEVILTTDADCIVPPRWVETMVSYLSPTTAFVAGPVAVPPSTSALAKLEHLELLGLMTVTAGLIGSDRPIVCNGANLCYRRSAFDAVDGFGSGTSANDDEVLMHRIKGGCTGSIAFADTPHAVVATTAHTTPSSFLRQRIRWASKRGSYEDRTILLELMAVYFFFVSIFVTAAMALTEPMLLAPVGLVLAGKVVSEYFALTAGGRMLGQPVSVGWFLAAEVLHIPYILIAAPLGQTARITWKGRSPL